jgi:hypothetical protein
MENDWLSRTSTRKHLRASRNTLAFAYKYAYNIQYEALSSL